MIRPRTAPAVDAVAQLKCLMWFGAVLLTVLAFPIQVYTMSPYPSLLPYVMAGLIAAITMMPRTQGLRVQRQAPRSSNIGLLVSIYLFLLLGNTAWQVGLSFITITEGFNAIAIYALPVVWYFYFRRSGSEHEIRAVLVAMAISGLIVGGYFAYDSYVKLGLGDVSDYARRAYEYSMSRVEMTVAEASDTRVRLNDRSYGLLQTHAVSGAWVALGAFACLALLPPTARAVRRLIVVAFGAMVVMGLNFTSIVAFAAIMFLIEFGGVSMVKGRTTEILKNFVPLTIVVAVLAWISYELAGEAMSTWINYFFEMQTDFALERGDTDRGLLLGALDSIGGYLQHSFDNPVSLIIGDGFSSWGLPKGGDTGFTESAARLGMLFYSVSIFGIIGLIASALRQVKVFSGLAPAPDAVLDHQRVLRFAISVSLLVLICDLHYSIWTAKSVLPILFFVLALYERILDLPRRTSFLGV